MVVLPTTTDTPSVRTEDPQVFRVSRVLKLQRWQMITIVLDNRHLDVYHNTALTRSFFLPNVPYLNNSNGGLWKRPVWTMYPGSAPFGGTLSCARYFDYAFNNHEVYRLYRWHRPKKNNAPVESYYGWWMWHRGTTFTGLYRAFLRDGENTANWLTFGLTPSAKQDA